jgi:hypothetical protein
LSIKTHCPKCGKLVAVPLNCAGADVKCECGHVISVVKPLSSRGSILEGKNLYAYMGEVILDRSARRVHGAYNYRGFIKKFVTVSFLLHGLIIAGIMGAMALEFFGTASAPASLGDDVYIHVAGYSLDGTTKTKYAPEESDDFDRGRQPSSPGFAEDLRTMDVRGAELPADQNPPKIDAMDSSPRPSETRFASMNSREAPASVSQPEAPAEKAVPAEHVVRVPGALDDGSEPVEKKLERILGHGPSATEGKVSKKEPRESSEAEEAEESNSHVSFAQAEHSEPRKAANAAKPKSFSYTQWKKYLQARAVMGREGGKGTKGAVTPGGGTPEFFGEPVTAKGKRAVFVIDYSRTMGLATANFPDLDGTEVGGSKFDRARCELKRAIAALKEDVQFSIVFFCEEYEVWKKELVPATDENKNAAFAFADGRELSGSWTDITSAVLAAFKLIGKNGSVVFLTDGAPNAFKENVNEEDSPRKSAERINEANTNRIPIHSFGFFHDNDKEKGEEFLKKIASESGGVYVEVK